MEDHRELVEGLPVWVSRRWDIVGRHIVGQGVCKKRSKLTLHGFVEMKPGKLIVQDHCVVLGKIGKVTK